MKLGSNDAQLEFYQEYEHRRCRSFYFGGKGISFWNQLNRPSPAFLFPLQHVLQTKMDNVQEVLCHILHLDFDRSGATTQLYIWANKISKSS
jgi:hypothetical protein